VTDRYVGGELELFATATNWKRYVARVLRPFIGAKVLEVGAGIGSNLPYLSTAAVREWTSLEPDSELAHRIAARVAAGELPRARVICGAIGALNDTERFDTIFYIDVLEHIAEDRAELARAARHLAPGGALVVVAPAHQFLFSPFDTAVGHHRRYTRASLAALAPPGCRLTTALMLDSVGFLASLGNRLLLSSAVPKPSQIAFWDRVLVVLSRWVDRLTFRRFGKTVVAVWHRAT
jgi:SAM-dependent methyltransferase